MIKYRKPIESLGVSVTMLPCGGCGNDSFYGAVRIYSTIRVVGLKRTAASHGQDLAFGILYPSACRFG
jgi:hypothetical protein